MSADDDDAGFPEHVGQRDSRTRLDAGFPDGARGIEPAVQICQPAVGTRIAVRTSALPTHLHTPFSVLSLPDFHTNQIIVGLSQNISKGEKEEYEGTNSLCSFFH